MLLISVLIYIIQQKRKQINLKFIGSTMTWQLSEDGNNWAQVDRVSIICVNSSIVWIVLEIVHRRFKAIVIGSNSLSAERFLQFRRCILRPEIFSKGRSI